MTHTAFLGSDIIEELDDGSHRDIASISWKIKDGRYCFYLKPAMLDDKPAEAEHYVSIHYADEYGRHYARDIKLVSYIGETQQEIHSDEVVQPPTWEYIGYFIRPWTKLVKNVNNNGHIYWEYPKEEKKMMDPPRPSIPSPLSIGSDVRHEK